jgi:hypothetical protein
VKDVVNDQNKFAENVKRSPESMDAARKTIEAAVANNYLNEAAGNAEDIVSWLQQEWASRGFSPEQCVFALALATINFRETMPENFGGKEMFDRVAHEAHKYYQANK